jgi:transcriptional regulator with PAS, ATPase and Fis domain
MQPFDERDTISVPVDSGDVSTVLGARVVALRIYGQADSIPIEPGVPLTIGAAATCDVPLADPCVSGEHCVVEWRGGRTVVRDLDSKNGTFVNGTRVVTADLRPGAVVAAGMTSLLALGDESRPAHRSALESLVGEDPAFRAAIEMAVRAGRNQCNVLILGETGTGKELFARLVHDSSPRAASRFVALNCGAIPRELVASELFGHARGAFTGATDERAGVFMQAHRGTLFLDEIGELPLELQPNLLRALETGRVRRVGGAATAGVDVQVVAATNRADSGLRRDLYHRLATIVLRLPPLRERRADIPRLVHAFLDELRPTHGRRRVSRAAVLRLGAYPWPGNVRELRQAVQRAVALGGRRLKFEDFMPEQRRYQRGEPAPDPFEQQTMQEVMRDVIRDALERHGSYRRAAKALGISKSTFSDRARRFGFESPIVAKAKPRED